jgi:protein subunit release factor A
LTLLRAKLYELELEKQQSEIAAKRRSQVRYFRQSEN